MDRKLSFLLKVGFLVASLGMMVGCSSDAGPNDPVKTSAEIEKIGKSMEQPSDGTPPAAGTPGGAKR